MNPQRTCPECKNDEQYYRRNIRASGGEGPHLLPGLGRWFRFPRFDVVVCAKCGLVRNYAEPSAREAAKTSSRWERLR